MPSISFPAPIIWVSVRLIRSSSNVHVVKGRIVVEVVQNMSIILDGHRGSGGSARRCFPGS